jgi:hypothetical protein
MIAALVMGAVGFEAGASLLIDQPGRRIGKAALGIAERLTAFGPEEQGPACSEPLEHVIGARAG